MTHTTPEGHTVSLADDGTLDTVLQVHCACGYQEDMRFSQEYAVSFRDSTGAMTPQGFEVLAEEACDDLAEYHECPPKARPMCQNCGEHVLKTRPVTYVLGFGGPCTLHACDDCAKLYPVSDGGTKEEGPTT